MLDTINRVYAFYDELSISMTGWILIAVVCLLGLLFTLREIATWFFKVGDVKKDLARLQETMSQLEGEIRVLQGLFTKEKLTLVVNDSSPASSAETSEKVTLKKADKTSGGFPIVH